MFYEYGSRMAVFIRGYSRTENVAKRVVMVETCRLGLSFLNGSVHLPEAKHHEDCGEHEEEVIGHEP